MLEMPLVRGLAWEPKYGHVTGSLKLPTEPILSGGIQKYCTQTASKNVKIRSSDNEGWYLLNRSKTLKAPFGRA